MKSNVVTRNADAVWKGSIKQGTGLTHLGSRSLEKHRYSLACRLDPDDRSEVNPEELLASAAASCFSMQLSKVLTDQGKLPTELEIHAEVDLEVGNDGPSISRLRLDCAGSVPDTSETEFSEAVKTTQETCPIYRLLKPGFQSIEVTSRLRKSA